MKSEYKKNVIHYLYDMYLGCGPKYSINVLVLKWLTWNYWKAAERVQTHFICL